MHKESFHKKERCVKNMCKAIEEMREESYRRGVQAGGEQKVLENIKNIMEGLKYTAPQAMELLKIPASEQSKYLSKL